MILSVEPVNKKHGIFSYKGTVGELAMVLATQAVTPKDIFRFKPNEEFKPFNKQVVC